MVRPSYGCQIGSLTAARGDLYSPSLVLVCMRKIQSSGDQSLGIEQYPSHTGTDLAESLQCPLEAVTPSPLYSPRPARLARQPGSIPLWPFPPIAVRVRFSDALFVHR